MCVLFDNWQRNRVAPRIRALWLITRLAGLKLDHDTADHTQPRPSISGIGQERHVSPVLSRLGCGN
jgi:hypothetical protein